MPINEPEQRARYYLHMLYWALVEVRLAGWDGKGDRCASIADAFHNLPALVERLMAGEDAREEEESFARSLAAEAESGGWSSELKAWEHYATERVVGRSAKE